MSELQETLRTLRRELAAANTLAPAERSLLETTAEDIARALRLDSRSTTDTSAPGELLEQAAVRLETEHPGVASAVRALLDALAKAGI
jgi:hypothetical protein